MDIAGSLALGEFPAIWRSDRQLLRVGAAYVSVEKGVGAAEFQSMVRLRHFVLACYASLAGRDSEKRRTIGAGDSRTGVSLALLRRIFCVVWLSFIMVLAGDTGVEGKCAGAIRLASGNDCRGRASLMDGSRIGAIALCRRLRLESAWRGRRKCGNGGSGNFWRRISRKRTRHSD